MIYKFRSKAAADLIMMGPNGDRLLRILGREPAPKGIIEVADMPAARRAIEAAVAEDEARRAGRDDEADVAQRVSLRTRVWPMLQMLARAEAAGEPVVWGV